MKIKINRETITMAQENDARDMAKADAEWIDAEVLRYCAAAILKSATNDSNPMITNVITNGSLWVTMNRWALTVWAEDMTVEYWSDNGPAIAILSFDVHRVHNGETDAFVQLFSRTWSGVTA